MAEIHHHTPERPVSMATTMPAPVHSFFVAALVFGLGLLALAIAFPGTGLMQAIAALVVYGAAVATAARSLAQDHPFPRLGFGNLTTLLRLALTAALIAPVFAGTGTSWPVFAVALAALSLDGIDGWLARRQGLTSAFGARFDMEVDAGLALVLALNVLAGGDAGWAILLLGLPRYAFIGAMALLPWMRRELPERFSRKAICVLQVGALIALQAPILPHVIATALEMSVAAALAWSFAHDIVWLWRQA